MSDKTITLTQAVRYRLPLVPNFILADTPAQPRQAGFTEAPKVEVCDLSLADLEAIGKAWTAALIARAHAQRQQRESLKRLGKEADRG